MGQRIDYLRGKPSMRQIFTSYLMGLPFALLVFSGFGKPAGCVAMIVWGVGMLAYLARRWPADSDERQAIYALSVCAVVIGLAGLIGVA